MRADKAKVVDEIWDEERIDSFLEKGAMGSESEEFSQLLHAYRSMRFEDFERFLAKFVAQGGNPQAKAEDGRTLYEVVKSHTKSAQFVTLLES